MSFLMWQRGSDLRIGSPRIVLRAAEVPLLKDAHSLRTALEQARSEQARQISAAAEAARAEARAQGFEQGRIEAREQMSAALTSVAQQSACEQEKLRNEIGALALQVVRKMLGNFADDAILVGLADVAATDIIPAQQLVLFVHPDLCAAVQKRLAANATRPAHESQSETRAGDAERHIKQAGGGHVPLRYEVRPDAACARDTCRIETEHGSVDASLESQLQRLEAVWIDAHASIQS